MADRPPAVHRVLAEPALAELRELYGHETVVNAVRAELAVVRANGRSDAAAAVAARVADRFHDWDRPALVAVINATGIVLHTNLGRAPLAESAAEAARAAGSGYVDLELDLTDGRRSSRQLAVRDRLRRLLGAETALVVNNCAAATLLALRALAAGREVIVSRGQLVEIGGSYRIPEILAVSGAVLREVGTTNVTRIGDYERAITSSTAALLRVHASNYRVRGFTHTPSLAEMIALARRHQLPVIDDIGSGALVDPKRFGFRDEPWAAESLRTGADLVLFSGDKLLGGPQCGIAAGRAPLIQSLERDPLMRAVRPDKMTLAALDETLRLSLGPRRWSAIPALAMLSAPVSELKRRAEAIADRLRSFGLSVAVLRSRGYSGGGTLPDQPLTSVVVALTHPSIDAGALSRRLRTGTPAVLGRVRRGRLLLDPRTVLPGQDEVLIEAVRRAAQPEVTATSGLEQPADEA